ncbi:MAG: biotin-dependent carboxyltransferase family protein, partial [Bradyrhizobiaceae bacterium]|nr:biotin-dependent carboxyltransferase family protein [Bradyrhizobiaceae bacterium]
RDAPAIEVSLGGVELSVEGGELSVAVVGGAFRLTYAGREFTTPAMVRLIPHAPLAIRAGSEGAWCYVAVAGSLDVPATLGSVSTHVRSGIGGLQGRALAAGDVLMVSTPQILEPEIASIAAPWLVRGDGPIRVVLGPQHDYFSADQIARFLQGPWTLSSRGDRMAYILDGTPLVHAKGFNIVSDGVAMGAIQVPGDGFPMVLMADRQPTGGYPKIATVIGVDLGRLAQRRAGAQLSFQEVCIEEAVSLRRGEATALAAPIMREALIRTELSSEFLLATNLVGGVSSGDEMAS